MNKNHAYHIDEGQISSGALCYFTEYYGFKTIGSEKNPAKFVYASKFDLIRIFKENQSITQSFRKPFFDAEIKKLKSENLPVDTFLMSIKHELVGVDPPKYKETGLEHMKRILNK